MKLFKTSILLYVCLLVPTLLYGKVTPNEISSESKKCIECHTKTSPSLVQMWGKSKHYRAKVSCFECHKAHPNDKDMFIHYGQRIATIVSPKDCSSCHSREVKEFAESHHAQGGDILGSLDNVLAEVVEGNSAFVTKGFPHGNSAAAVMGCWQCHGSKVKVLEGGKLDPATWPNTGIGRINPDGSKGSCTACHSRHQFSVEQARNPETCGKCHMGPDHPQLEIYNESKHGIAYKAHKEKLNMGNPKWIPGEDYSQAPTCATCHMSATKDMPVTHDIGLRISWNNRPPVSVRPEVSDAKLGLPGAKIGWKKRRKMMKNVCTSCHNSSYVDNFYTQYDAIIELYNDKFAKPGIRLMKLAGPLRKRKPKFSNKIDYVWFEIWHHEGRRMRHGASMMGPDYTHWHGSYEVAKHFYSSFIPLLEKMVKENKNSKDSKKAAAAKALEAELNKTLNENNHKWFLGKMSKEDAAKRKKAAKDFSKRYNK